MKKFTPLIILILISFFCALTPMEVTAKEVDNDEVINEVFDGINQEDFNFIIEFLNSVTGENLNFKQAVLKFLTGELNVNFSTLINFFKSDFNNFISLGGEVIIYLILLGVTFNIINVISSKNKDNIAKYTIYFIGVLIACSLIFGVTEKVFSYAKNELNFLSKIIEAVFPIMFSVTSLVGNFGVSIIKPFTAFLTLLVSSLSINLFMPLLYFETTVTSLNNLSENVKLTGLKKTASGVYKWALLLILGVYSLTIGGQSLVSAQYSGVSVKLLKYFTGSLIPVVGNFLSGGMEVLLSSAVLIKNGIGLISVIAVIFSVGKTAIEILIFSFIIKFLSSICEPILDEKYYSILSGVTDVFNSLAGLLLVCGFTFIITVLFLVTATAYVF